MGGAGAGQKMECQFDERIVHRAYVDELRKLGILNDRDPSSAR